MATTAPKLDERKNEEKNQEESSIHELSCSSTTPLSPGNAVSEVVYTIDDEKTPDKTHSEEQSGSSLRLLVWMTINIVSTVAIVRHQKLLI